MLLSGAFRGGRRWVSFVEAAAATLSPPERPLALAAGQLGTLFAERHALESTP